MKLTFALLLLIACMPIVMAQGGGTYTQIDVPGAIGTVGYAVNSAGDVAGIYTDSSYVQHGFVLSGGTYTTIDYPGASGTELFGLNDVGQVVGTTATTPTLGFLYDIHTQTFTTVSYPGATSTTPIAINNAGDIAGQFDEYSSFGFELVGSTYRRIGPPGASNSNVRGIAAAPGQLVGYVFSSGKGYENYLLSGGKYQHVNMTDAPGAVVQAVNPAGTAVVGYYAPSSGVYAGFLFQDKALTTLQFPGSNETLSFGINAAGEVVGFFLDAEDNGHGFTWTPPAAETKK